MINNFIEGNFEWIFVDEFTISDRNYNPYGWGFKWRKSICSVYPGIFKIMFIVGVSSKNRYFTRGTTGNGTAALFTYFLKKIINNFQTINKNRKNLIITWDNSSIHKTDEVRDFLKNSGSKMLTIVSYSPWLNPVEKYIGSF